jgi:ThiF family
MADRREYFSRVAGRVDVRGLTDRFVVLVGVGSVGSLMALELARCGVGHMVLVDGDKVEVQNLSRHVALDHYVGTNKAEALATHLRLNVPDLDVGAAPHNLDESFSDEQIDELLAPADLIVIATDERRAQRRIARRALAMDIPAVIPGLYADRGGEVFVQLNPGEACFMCWDGFRDDDLRVRGVSSVNADAFAVIQQSIYLSIAILEPGSRHARDLAPSRQDPRPRQLFVLHPGAALVRTPVARRDECEGCAVGPSPLNGELRTTSPETPAAAGFFERVASREIRPRAAGWPFVLTGIRVPPTIASVELSRPLVVEGETVRLSWRTHNATQVEVTGHGTHPPEGDLVAVVRSTMAFQVRAINPFGEEVAMSPPVRTMPLPRVREFQVLGFPAVTSTVPELPSLSFGVSDPYADSSIGGAGIPLPALPMLPSLAPTLAIGLPGSSILDWRGFPWPDDENGAKE